MDILWSSVELTRVVFIIGAILALLYKKRFGVTPGGIIVPGVLTCVLFASYIAFVMTILTAIACYFIYKLTFGKFALDRRWASLILISMSTVIGLLQMKLLEITHILSYDILLLSLVAPGLIAISARKYTMQKVIFGMMGVTSACYIIGLLLIALLPYGLVTQLSVQLAAYQQLSLSNPYIVLPVSLVISILVYYRFGIRGGGYLIAPFIAVVTFSSVIQAILLAIGIGLSYVLIRLALRFTLIIGLERFVFSLLCGYIFITLTDILAAAIEIPGYRPSSLIMIIAIAVCTNDLSLQPLKSSLKNGFLPSQVVAHLARWAV